MSNVKRHYDENGIGTLMFVFLLSFGLFFALGGIKEKSPFSLNEPTETFKPFSERIFTKGDNFKPTGFNGDLLTNNPRIKEVFEKSTKIPTETISPSPQVEDVIVGSKNANYSLQDVEEKFLDNPSSTQTNYVKIEETSEDEDVVMVDVEVVGQQKGFEDILMANIQFAQNTTYLMCEKVKYLTPSQEVEINPDAPLKLSLFIASNDLTNSPEDILEVSCQITDISQMKILRSSNK